MNCVHKIHLSLFRKSLVFFVNEIIKGSHFDKWETCVGFDVMAACDDILSVKWHPKGTHTQYNSNRNLENDSSFFLFIFYNMWTSHWNGIRHENESVYMNVIKVYRNIVYNRVNISYFRHMRSSFRIWSDTQLNET